MSQASVSLNSRSSGLLTQTTGSSKLGLSVDLANEDENDRDGMLEKDVFPLNSFHSSSSNGHVSSYLNFSIPLTDVLKWPQVLSQPSPPATIMKQRRNAEKLLFDGYLS